MIGTADGYALGDGPTGSSSAHRTGAFQDHTQLIPLFVVDWKNSSTKIKLLGVSLEADPSNVSERLSIRCSFGYFYHVTVCLGSSFENEFWFAQLLTNTFHRNWGQLVSQIPAVLHFACLFRDSGARSLFDTICNHLAIQCQEDVLSDESMQYVVDQLVHNLDSPQAVSIWGNEALKWLFGCSSLEIAVRSFVICNRIFTHFDNSIFNAVVRTVSYHLEHNSHDPKGLSQLVSEAFKFFTIVLKGNETLAFNFVCAFLDCRIFVENSLIHSLAIFMECLSRREFHDEACNHTISMIRPLIKHLETKPQAQEIIENMIHMFNDDELMMIALPVKLHRPSLFPSCLD
jgi:hypothetical protein